MFPYFTLNKQTGEIKEVSAVEWSVWFEDVENRRIEYTNEEDFCVSTVFLGIDHSYGCGDQMLLYESCILEGPPEIQGNCYRYATMAEAKSGHYAILSILRGESIEDIDSVGEPSIMNMIEHILEKLGFGYENN